MRGGGVRLPARRSPLRVTPRRFSSFLARRRRRDFSSGVREERERVAEKEVEFDAS